MGENMTLLSKKMYGDRKPLNDFLNEQMTDVFLRKNAWASVDCMVSMDSGGTVEVMNPGEKQ